MSAWHDRVGDLTLFEALTGGALDVKTDNIAGNLTKIFQKSQMPGGLPGGGMGGFGIDRYIITFVIQSVRKKYFLGFQLCLVHWIV